MVRDASLRDAPHHEVRRTRKRPRLAPRPFRLRGYPRSAPEQREKDDDRQRNAEQPEQCAFAKTHISLLCFVARKTPNPRSGSGSPAKARRVFLSGTKTR